MTARWKAHKGKVFLRHLTAQRVHTFLQKETAVSARFWTEDLSRVRRTWWPLHYRNLQPGLSLSFQSWILGNFTTYGAWPPVTYLTYLTGPTQVFRGQCINKSLFKFIVILVCKTYNTTLRKHPVTSSYTLQLININIYTEKGPSTESLCRPRQISYSCNLTIRNLFDRASTGFSWTMH